MSDFAAMAAAEGFAVKPRNVSNVLIREDAPNTFRVMCFDCLTQFDLFGRLAPADETSESAIVQRIVEHIEKCSDRKHLRETFIIKNLHSPLYKLTVKWGDGSWA